MILNLMLNGPLVWPTVDEENGTSRTKNMKNFQLQRNSKLTVILKLQTSFFKVFHQMCMPLLGIKKVSVTFIISLDILESNIWKLNRLVRKSPWKAHGQDPLAGLLEHGRMILESVEHGPLIWPTIEENGVTRTKKYEELSATEKIQADCDLKATNIILQGLPSDVYSLVNHHRVAKVLWERVQLLILSPEWSKFVTDVKLVRYFHTTNFDQLNAYLKQHELHANKVHASSQSIPQIEYTVFIVNQQPHIVEFPIDSGLSVPVFKQGDDPIDAINKMMSFLSTIVTSRFPTTNNQLRNSSNPRQQEIIHDGRVTVQLVQGRQSSFAAGEGHMAIQCPKPKRKRDATWFRDKVLLVEAQGSGKVLNEEELEFLADPGVAEVLMANLSSYELDVLSEVPHSENTHNDMLNQSVQEMPYSEQTHLVNYPDNEITSDSNIIPYSQYLLETQNAAVQDINSSAQQDAMILSVFEQLSNQVTNCNKVNKD
ncbi:hypothetical protein Tco_1297184, partial [Tanacetum coccineum]